MKKIHLSDGEWNIMRLLWEDPPKTITQLTAELKASTGWSKHTIITMLGRMTSKGAVQYKEGARAKQYYPAIEKEEAALLETTGFLEKVYSGSLSLMLNTMIGKNSLSQSEIEELYAVLKRAEEGKK